MPKIVEDIKFSKFNRSNSNPRMHSSPHVKRSSFGVRKSIIILLVLVVFFSGVYFISNKFSHVTVVLTEKKQTFMLSNKEFTFSKDAMAPMHFELMIIPDQEFKAVTLTQTQNISTKAQGSVILYNDYSAKPQKLVAGTYLADEAGKAYKLDNAVSIPGHGSAAATITAFLPGDTYNGNPTHFTISSFKNTDRYAKIYATATSPMSGGAEGLMYVGAITNQTISKEDILQKIDVPPGYILYPDASTFSSATDQNVLSKTPDAKVAIHSTLSAILIKKDDLTKALIESVIPGVSDAEEREIELTNLNDLTFTFTDPSQTITKDLQIVDFTLTGDLHAIWHPDIPTLKQTLLGVPKNTTQTIFAQDVGIASAQVKIFPLWMSYLPDDVSKIDIKVQ